MSRKIDTTKKLSKADLQYLRDRDDPRVREHVEAQVAGVDFGQAQLPDPNTAPDTGEGGAQKAIEDMTVAELQDQLRALDQPVSGTKEELQQRLVEAQPQQ